MDRSHLRFGGVGPVFLCPWVKDIENPHPSASTYRGLPFPPCPDESTT